MDLPIEFDLETDGRWIAEVPALPGVLVYGESKDEARRKVQALALSVLADQLQNGERDFVNDVHFSEAAAA